MLLSVTRHWHSAEALCHLVSDVTGSMLRRCLGFDQAVAFIKGTLSVYDLGCRWMFTCGQQAYADFVQISNNNVERRRIQDAAVRYGRSCRRVRDRFEVMDVLEP